MFSINYIAIYNKILYINENLKEELEKIAKMKALF